jgi:hypothetical protein
MPYLIRARGLATYDNELNLPDGSLTKADNIIIDRRDVIECRRGYADYGTSFGTSTDRANQLLIYKNRLIRHINNELSFDDGNGTFTAFNGTYEELEAGLRLKYIESNSNFYFTTSDGVKKISATSASEFSSSSGYITNAGGPKALDITGNPEYNISGFLTASSRVGYRVVWGINDVNNNLILGTPSARLVITNNSEDITTQETATIATVADSSDSLDGTYFLINDGNDNGYFVWFNTSGGSATTPETSETLGRTEVEVNINTNDGANTVAAVCANKLADLGVFNISLVSNTITVTNLTGDNVTDAVDSAISPTGFTITVTSQGNITLGQTANVNLTFVLPDEVDNINYFYQVYRTGIVTTSTGVTLDDLDPGDEMNLIIESQVTSAEISAGEVTLTDETPDSFRESGTLLYTNPISGEGILQANDKPPLAKDINLFNDTAFYANTENIHRKNLTLLSVSAFTSTTSKLYIANNNAIREYTFVGQKEISQVICDTKANTTDGGYFLLNSASDEYRYFVWFDKTGSTSEPSAADTVGKIAVRVNISGDTTATDVGDSLAAALDSLSDFSASNASGTVTITAAKNGNVTDITAGLTSPDPGGTLWAFSVTQQGDGEDSASNHVLLSSLASIGQAIDETARSLVNIINKDSSGIVYAYYLSTSDTLPGQILLESRDFSNQFYLAVNESAIQNQWNPELPLAQSITSISAANPTVVTIGSHGYSNGDILHISGTDSTPALFGTYEISNVTASTFTVPVNVTGSGTTGIAFNTTVFSDNEVSPNRVYYSKPFQPEAVPLINYFDVGPKDKPIRRILSLRDNLFILKEDGVYIVSASGNSYITKLLDNSTNIISPDSAQVLNNQIFMLASKGVVVVSDTGIGIISKSIEDDILNVTKSNYDYEYTSFGLSYESDSAYLLWLPTSENDTIATQCYRYHADNGNWTRWTKSNTCGIINTADDKMYLGAGDRNDLEKERKNTERQDYADREFNLSIPSDGVNDTTITLSTIANANVGDVLVQNQYITIEKFNRLLEKLDRDPGLDDTDYFSTLQISQGDNLSTAMQNLATKLTADDSSQTYTSTGITFPQLRDDFNTIIGKLNDPASDSFYTDYRTYTSIIPLETIITAIDRSTNEVTVAYYQPFLEGEIILYEKIEVEIDWAPQHLGDPESLKQINWGSIIFDGNNYYSAILAYSSDLNKSFEEIEIFGKGTGTWGGFPWSAYPWGGEGSDIPNRVLIPKQKQRCRYIFVKFKHSIARDAFKIVGITLNARKISTKSYR